MNTAFKYKNRSQFQVGVLRCMATENLSQGERCFLHTLKDTGDYKTGLSSPGNDLLMAGCGVSTKEGVRYIARSLESKRLIEHIARGQKYRAATYRIRIEDDRFPEPKVSASSSRLNPETKISGQSSGLAPEKHSQGKVTEVSGQSKTAQNGSQGKVTEVSGQSSGLAPYQKPLPNTFTNNNNNTTALAVGDVSKELQKLPQSVKSAILASEQKQLRGVTNDVVMDALTIFNQRLKSMGRSEIKEPTDFYTARHYAKSQSLVKKHGRVKYLLGLALSFRDWQTNYTIKYQRANRHQEPDAWQTEQIMQETATGLPKTQIKSWLLDAYQKCAERYILEIGELSPEAIEAFGNAPSALDLLLLTGKKYNLVSGDYPAWNIFLESYDGSDIADDLNALPACQDTQTLLAGGVLCEGPVTKIENPPVSPRRQETPPSVQMPVWAVKDFDVWRCSECRVKVCRGGFCEHQEDCSHFVASESAEDQELEVAVAAGGVA